MILATSSSSYAQLISVLVIFIAVLAVTAGVSKWLAKYQKTQLSGRNIEIIESMRLTNNKWVSIVRIGDTYKAIAVCKDTVTFLGDVNPDSVVAAPTNETGSFQGFFEKALGKSHSSESEEDGTNED